MTRREIIKLVLDGGKPPYVPWSFKFTKEPHAMLCEYFGTDDLDPVLGNHILQLGSDIGFFEEIAPDQWQDLFGVVWDRSVDKDIGVVANCALGNRRLRIMFFRIPATTGFSKRSYRKRRVSRIFSGSFKSDFRFTNGPGHYEASKTC